MLIVYRIYKKFIKHITFYLKCSCKNNKKETLREQIDTFNKMVLYEILAHIYSTQLCIAMLRPVSYILIMSLV